MPIYEYQCSTCGVRDYRVAGPDDDTAICAYPCLQTMRRLDNPLGPPAPKEHMSHVQPYSTTDYRNQKE